jgi:prolyl 4-hydroxylase
MKWVLLFLAVLSVTVFIVKIRHGFARADDDYEMPVVHKNLVTPEEASYIIAKAKKSFTESSVVGGFDVSIRKSKTAWLDKDDPTVLSVIKRLTEGHPVENTESLQVVEYQPGGYYNEHHDSCCEKDEKCDEFVKRGGQRVLTVLVYLNDDFTGGSTRFPNLNRDFKPPKFGGLVFRPLEKGGNRCHPLALHKGTPVESGTKYICNVWVRERKFT